jgi:S-formylglutathione hydrolase FrmB
MRPLLIGLVVAACSNNTSAPAVVASDPGPQVAPAVAAKGKVVTELFQSAALGVPKNVVVYLPAGYDAQPAKRWPVFYYLHGLGGTETNWVKSGKLDAAADSLGLQAIVVMPDGDNGFYVDSDFAVDYDACIKDGTGLLFPDAPRMQTCVKQLRYATYITEDLIGWVDRTYRTINTREGRAIAGLSMGGFGALVLGMKHPDLFAAAASHSGVDALLYAGPHPYERGQVKMVGDVKDWGGKLGPLGGWVRALFGPDIARWRAHDPAALVENVAPNRPALYLDAGTEDEFFLHNGAQLVHDLLVARTIEHTWYIGPGHHTFDFWAERVPVSLGFLRDHVAAAR